MSTHCPPTYAPPRPCWRGGCDGAAEADDAWRGLLDMFCSVQCVVVSSVEQPVHGCRGDQLGLPDQLGCEMEREFSSATVTVSAATARHRCQTESCHAIPSAGTAQAPKAFLKCRAATLQVCTENSLIFFLKFKFRPTQEYDKCNSTPPPTVYFTTPRLTLNLIS